MTVFIRLIRYIFLRLKAAVLNKKNDLPHWILKIPHVFALIFGVRWIIVVGKLQNLIEKTVIAFAKVL
jgi:hypothetical protein